MKQMVHLNLQILYDCNFKCQICNFWKEEYQHIPMITLDQVQILKEKIRNQAPLIISIGGGEPLLHPHLEEIIAVLSEDHFPVMICNGWFITPEKARALFQAGMMEISISIDYADPAKHDRQRNKVGAFEQGIEALRILNENRTSPHQRVHMISVVMADNLQEIEPLIQLAGGLGITYMVTCYSNSRGLKDHNSMPSETGAFLRSLHKKYKNFVSLPGYIENFGQPQEGCFTGKNLFNIDCQGNVSRCIDSLDQPVGNIFQENPDLIFAKLRTKQQDQPCGQCWTSCRGSIETLMYGKNRLQNLIQSHQITKRVPLVP